jgi:Phosphopantetheine attachment site
MAESGPTPDLPKPSCGFCMASSARCPMAARSRRTTASRSGRDPFHLMRIIAAVEQAFDIEFPDSALALTTFESVGSLAAAVETPAREQPGPPPDDRQL